MKQKKKHRWSESLKWVYYPLGFNLLRCLRVFSVPFGILLRLRDLKLICQIFNCLLRSCFKENQIPHCSNYCNSRLRNLHAEVSPHKYLRFYEDIISNKCSGVKRLFYFLYSLPTTDLLLITDLLTDLSVFHQIPSTVEQPDYPEYYLSRNTGLHRIRDNVASRANPYRFCKFARRTG